MLFKTHLAFTAAVSELVYMSVSPFIGNIDPKALAIISGMIIFGTLFPDIDEPNSTISKAVPGFIPTLIKRIFGHRGITHTIVGIIGFSILLYMFLTSIKAEFPLIYTLSFAWGYTLHIIEDMTTYSGVKGFMLTGHTSKIGIFGSYLVGSYMEYMILIFSLLVNIFFFIYIILT